MSENLLEIAAKQVLNEVMEKVAREMIIHQAGYGLDTEVKRAVLLEAQRILKEDNEVKTMLRDRLISWIKQA